MKNLRMTRINVDMKKWFVFILFFFSCCSYVFPKTSFKLVPSKMTTVHQEADRLEYDDKKKVIHLYGHVKLWEEKTTLIADQGTYNLKTQTAEAEGNVKMTGPEGEVSGDHLTLYYPQKRAIIHGNVVLIYTPQNAHPINPNISANDGPVTLSANEVEYRWGERIATAEGGVLIVHKNGRARGDHALFEERTYQATMDGHVKLLRPPQNELDCDHLVYFLRTNQASADGHVIGTFLVEEKKTAPVPVQKNKKTPSKAKQASSSPAEFVGPPTDPKLQPETLPRI